ncbi:hypothetical protein [Nocardioides sp.]|uniref:hypothetical protein n=1 Tax=Nocardioides sp. TaxID=35761 RepID=UPI0027175EE5|nr:hypothetical protein [Nocardioides sp.]MDO9456028.1 hypothetical protein [Nocardioides sp.]
MANDIDPDKITAVQAVVDRVSSYQDTSTEGTLESELRKGLDEAGVDLTDDQVTALVDAIEEHAGEADAGTVLA